MTDRRCAGFSRTLLVVAAAAGLAGCALNDYSKVEISKRYPVGNNPSPACLDAARRATYWCERGVPRSDPDAQGKCLDAQWDHARAC
jgi:hypothetical protein